MIKILDCYDSPKQRIHAILHDGESDNEMVRGLARASNIPYRHLHLDKLTGKNVGRYVSDELLSFFEKNKIDYCFCFGSRILSGPFLLRYKMKIINFHPSILPMFPGVRAIDQALLSETHVLGNTAHFVDEGIDTGPIIMQSILPRELYRTCEDVLALQIPMFHQIADWLENGKLHTNGRRVRISGARLSPVFIPEIEEP